MKRLLGMLSLQRKFLLLGGLSLILFAVRCCCTSRRRGRPRRRSAWRPRARAGRHVAAGRAPGAGASRAVQPASERGREAGEERRRLAPGVDAQWRELDTRLREAAAPASALATLDALAQEWRALRKQVDDADIAAPASFERHTALVARLLLFKNTLLDDFKLSLDADLGASALIAAAYQDLPVAAETLGQVRAARRRRWRPASRARPSAWRWTPGWRALATWARTSRATWNAREPARRRWRRRSMPPPGGCGRRWTAWTN